MTAPEPVPAIPGRCPAMYGGRSEPPPSWLGPSSVPRAKNRANKAS
jgi:hypothetical protein